MQIENINLRRFFTKLQKDIVPNLTGENLAEDKQAALGLTALFLAAEAGMPVELSSTFVVDEGEDFGIDGLYFNNATQTLYIVQSKFRTNQSKTLTQGEMLKFKNGIERVLKGKVDGGAGKFLVAYEKIAPALNDINTRIKLCVVCTSTKDLAPNVSNIIESYCNTENSVDQIFSFSYYKFDQLYQMARFFSPETETDPDISIYSFGSITEPYRAFFGYVDGTSVAKWVKKYGGSLFEQNVRFTLHNTDVNESIFDTIRDEPEKFWYFNNGITAIASEAAPVPSDQNPRTVKTKSLSVVNGAQTAGMLARAAEEGLDLSKVRVQFRVISLAGATPGLDEEITRANNTQNELNSLDFVSLDPRQDLLRNEIAGLGYNYVFKRGSEDANNLQQIEVKDAAVALACAAEDIGISVQAKRYVSGLWSNIKTAPYTAIFDDSLTGLRLVQTWRAHKVSEAAIKQVRSQLDSEAARILTHGDRFISHCVFRKLAVSGQDLSDESKVTEYATKLAQSLPEVFKSHASGYAATVFKNQKTQELLKEVLLSTT